jgi:transcriptional regulator with XRE-family HTH domain
MLAPWPDDIGRLARQRRIDLDMSQGDLAERAGVTRQWLSRFEQAKADVSLAKALRVLRELGLVVDVTPRSDKKTSAGPARVPHISFGASLPTSDAIAKVNEVAKAYAAITAPLPAELQETLLRLNDVSAPSDKPHPTKKHQEKER